MIALTIAHSHQTIRDYWQLLKPRVMWLVGFSALVGFVLAVPSVDSQIDPTKALLALVAIVLGAGAAGALNIWYEADSDALMSRTCNRPICAGRISSRSALWFALFVAGLAVATLTSLGRWTTAWLLVATIIYYAWFYTVILKPWTAQSIVIGGAAGAIAPVLGWTAAGGSITAIEPWLYVLIIFLWTPPHFWALALRRSGDYAKASIPVLPAIKGIAYTKKAIVVYAFILWAAMALPIVFADTGWLYPIIAMSAGGLFCWQCLRLVQQRINEMTVFASSIFVLFFVLSGALLDQWLT